METRTLQYLVSAAGGRLVRGDASGSCTGATTDSRRVKAGNLFIALPGDRFDGHDFISTVAQAGARAVLVSRACEVPEGCAVVQVDNTRLALGRLAACYRGDFQLPVIAVAGSNGKTSTKELLAAVLRPSLPTLWSEASFNNDIGVPLTLLRLEAAHRAAVLELGTNHPGELGPLVQMARPQFGLITSIGREHLEHFGDLAGVAREEGALGELLPACGKLFLYGDSDWSHYIAQRSAAPVVTIGLAARNDWRAENITVDSTGATFIAAGPIAAACGLYRLNLLGRHHVTNALLAIAVAAELGLAQPAIAQGLAECQPAKGRLQSRDVRGVRLLDDTYNANADSVSAALSALCEMPCSGRRLVVLGDFSELGAHTIAAHTEAGRKAVESRVDVLLAVGEHAGVTAEAARAAGLAEVHVLRNNAEAGSLLRELARPGDVVLLKASRAARLEEVCAAFSQGA